MEDKNKNFYIFSGKISKRMVLLTLLIFLFLIGIFIAVPLFINWLFMVGEIHPIISTAFGPKEWLEYYAAFISAISTIALGIVATRQSQKAYDLQDKQHKQQLDIEETRQRLSVKPIFDCQVRRISIIVSSATENPEHLFLKTEPYQTNSHKTIIQTDAVLCTDTITNYEARDAKNLSVFVPENLKTYIFYKCTFKNTGLAQARVCEISLNINDDTKHLGAYMPSSGFEVICAVPNEIKFVSTSFKLHLCYKDVFNNTCKQIYSFKISENYDNITMSTVLID